MKSLIYASLTAIALLMFSCDKDDSDGSTNGGSDCQETVTTKNRSLNFIDFRPGTPYTNQAVATFKFTQQSNTYLGTSCPAMNCATTLVIQNNTNKKISFDYEVRFTLNFANWTYQGFASIPAGTSFDVGEVSQNCASISLGQFVIPGNGLVYE